MSGSSCWSTVNMIGFDDIGQEQSIATSTAYYHLVLISSWFSYTFNSFMLEVMFSSYYRCMWDVCSSRMISKTWCPNTSPLSEVLWIQMICHWTYQERHCSNTSSWRWSRRNWSGRHWIWSRKLKEKSMINFGKNTVQSKTFLNFIKHFTEWGSPHTHPLPAVFTCMPCSNHCSFDTITTKSVHMEVSIVITCSVVNKFSSFFSHVS